MPEFNIVLLLNNTPIFPVVDAQTVERLNRIGRVFQPQGDSKSWSAEQIRGWLADADAVITSWLSPRLTADLLDPAASPRLRFIGHAAGTVAPYVDARAWQRKIAVVSANLAMAPQVAEWAVALAMLSVRRWHEVREKLYGTHGTNWGRVQMALHSDSLCDQPVGLVGFGQVARFAVRMFRAFNCRVRVSAPESAEEIAAAGGEKAELPDLLRASRIVSLHVPLNEKTRGMIGAEQLAMVPDGGVLVNTARGKLLDHAALIAECRSGRIMAALDVTDPEPPPPDSPLWAMPNVIISPHCAGPVPRRQPDFGRMVAADLEAFLAGRPLAGEITAEHASIMTRQM